MEPCASLSPRCLQREGATLGPSLPAGSHLPPSWVDGAVTSCLTRRRPAPGSTPHQSGASAGLPPPSRRRQLWHFGQGHICESSEEPSLTLLALQRKQQHFPVVLQSQDHKTCASPQLTVWVSFPFCSLSSRESPACCFTFKQRKISGSAWLLKYCTSSTKLWYSNFCLRQFSVWSLDAVNC